MAAISAAKGTLPVKKGIMKKYYLLLLLAVCAVLLLGCGNESQSRKNKGAGTLEMESVSADAGAEDVIVSVSLKNNPGFLTMAVMIDYDSNALTLTGVSCGEAYLNYMFVAPQNKQSGCMASWLSTDMPEQIVDDVLLELHFSVRMDAASGDHYVTISCPDDGGIVGENREPIEIKGISGYVKVN